jgi:hypothetical protein
MSEQKDRTPTLKPGDVLELIFHDKRYTVVVQ